MNALMQFLKKIPWLFALLLLATSSGFSAESEAAEGEGNGAEEAGTGAEVAEEAPSAELIEESRVHERRMAQLRRLQDLAVENDRKDMISRVDGLIARELRRHAAAMASAETNEAESAEASEDNIDAEVEAIQRESDSKD